LSDDPPSGADSGYVPLSSSNLIDEDRGNIPKLANQVTTQDIAYGHLSTTIGTTNKITYKRAEPVLYAMTTAMAL